MYILKDFIMGEIISMSICKAFAWGYRVIFTISANMINLGCGLYTGFQNIIPDFHGCGLCTGAGYIPVSTVISEEKLQGWN